MARPNLEQKVVIRHLDVLEHALLRQYAQYQEPRQAAGRAHQQRLAVQKQIEDDQVEAIRTNPESKRKRTRG